MDAGAFVMGQVKQEVDCNDFNEVLDVSKPNLEYINHSEVCEDISIDEYTEQIKNEYEIDIVHEDFKHGIVEKKSNVLDRFSEACHKTFSSGETDFIKSTNTKLKCSCQDQKDINVQGEDMTKDVKPFTLTTDIGVELVGLQDESLSVEECAYVHSPATPQREILVSLLKNDKKGTSTQIPADLLFPNQCEICTKSFTNVVSLRIHDKKVHRKNDPHRCKYCKKCFAQRGGLVDHERIHTGEKPYHCKVCSKSFGHLKTLKTHERIHSSEKPFKCKICSKNFRLPSQLKIHGRIHKGEKPFPCKICSKCFASQLFEGSQNDSYRGEAI